MQCLTERIKLMCSKALAMEKEGKEMTERISLTDKLLGSGEDRVMFR